MWTPTPNPLRALISPILIETFFFDRPKSILLKSIEVEPRFRSHLNVLLKSQRVKWFLITSMNIGKKKSIHLNYRWCFHRQSSLGYHSESIITIKCSHVCLSTTPSAMPMTHWRCRRFKCEALPPACSISSSSPAGALMNINNTLLTHTRGSPVHAKKLIFAHFQLVKLPIKRPSSFRSVDHHFDKIIA